MLQLLNPKRLTFIVFKEFNIVVATSGNNQLVLGDGIGQIHLVSRSWQVTTFRGYELRVTLAEQLQNSPLLVTIGVSDTNLHLFHKM